MGVLRDERDIFSYEGSDDYLEQLDSEIREERKVIKKNSRKPVNKNRLQLINQLDNVQLGSSKKTGSKKSRRGENNTDHSITSRLIMEEVSFQKQHYQEVKFLMNLVEKEEDLAELSMEVGEPSMSAFAELFMEHEKMKIWNDFINSSEEEQKKLLEKEKSRSTRRVGEIEEDNGNSTDLNDSWEEIPDSRTVHPAYTAEECYQRLDRNIKFFLKRRNIPMGLLRFLEEELISFFKEWPGSVYVSKLSSSFERMLLHAICQYLDLLSSSFDDGNIRQTHVENKNPLFSPPPTLLSMYLQKSDS